MSLVDRLFPLRSERLSLAEAYFEQGGPLGGGLAGFTTFSVGGQTYTVPIQTTMPGQKAEAIANSFEGYALAGFEGNSVVFSLVSVRLRVFSEARFQWQRFNHGRPGDLFGDQSLELLENPWPGGVTGDLLAAMLLHSDLAGNAYVARINGQLVPMRPDWVEILLGDRRFGGGQVGMEKLGYLYYEGGKQRGAQPVQFLENEVAHFCPQRDPMANYRGMSWLTPLVREIQADGAAMGHKLKYFENAASPNLAISLTGITDKDQFSQFVDKMDDQHKGWQNAYKTLYLAGGAEVTVIGANLKDIDFGNVVGKGETRLAAAAGVPPTVAGLSEGLQGSSLNAGNFGQARRQFADMTLSPLWRNVAGSLEVLLEKEKPPGARLWYDTRDIPFLRQDQSDLASIQQAHAQAVRELFMAGFTPDSIISAVTGDDLTLLEHTGTFSIQVQTPGTTSTKLPSTVDEPPAGPEVPTDVKEVPAIPAAQAGAPVRAEFPMTDRATTIRELCAAGFTPDSVVRAVNADDLTRLIHPDQQNEGT